MPTAAEIERALVRARQEMLVKRRREHADANTAQLKSAADGVAAALAAAGTTATGGDAAAATAAGGITTTGAAHPADGAPPTDEAEEAAAALARDAATVAAEEAARVAAAALAQEEKAARVNKLIEALKTGKDHDGKPYYQGGSNLLKDLPTDATPEDKREALREFLGEAKSQNDVAYYNMLSNKIGDGFKLSDKKTAALLKFLGPSQTEELLNNPNSAAMLKRVEDGLTVASSSEETDDCEKFCGLFNVNSCSKALLIIAAKDEKGEREPTEKEVFLERFLTKAKEQSESNYISTPPELKALKKTLGANKTRDLLSGPDSPLKKVKNRESCTRLDPTYEQSTVSDAGADGSDAVAEGSDAAESDNLRNALYLAREKYKEDRMNGESYKDTLRREGSYRGERDSSRANAEYLLPEYLQEEVIRREAKTTLELHGNTLTPKQALKKARKNALAKLVGAVQTNSKGYSRHNPLKTTRQHDALKAVIGSDLMEDHLKDYRKSRGSRAQGFAQRFVEEIIAPGKIASNITERCCSGKAQDHIEAVDRKLKLAGDLASNDKSFTEKTPEQRLTNLQRQVESIRKRHLEKGGNTISPLNPIKILAKTTEFIKPGISETEAAIQANEWALTEFIKEAAKQFATSSPLRSHSKSDALRSCYGRKRASKMMKSPKKEVEWLKEGVNESSGTNTQGRKDKIDARLSGKIQPKDPSHNESFYLSTTINALKYECGRRKADCSQLSDYNINNEAQDIAQKQNGDKSSITAEIMIEAQKKQLIKFHEQAQKNTKWTASSAATWAWHHGSQPLRDAWDAVTGQATNTDMLLDYKSPDAIAQIADGNYYRAAPPLNSDGENIRKYLNAHKNKDSNEHPKILERLKFAMDSIIEKSKASGDPLFTHGKLESEAKAFAEENPLMYATDSGPATKRPNDAAMIRAYEEALTRFATSASTNLPIWEEQRRDYQILKGASLIDQIKGSDGSYYPELFCDAIKNDRTIDDTRRNKPTSRDSSTRKAAAHVERPIVQDSRQPPHAAVSPGAAAPPHAALEPAGAPPPPG